MPRTALLESLESRLLLSGVTLITHGLGADASDWVSSMAAAIAARPDLSADNFTTYKMTVTDPGHSGGALAVSISRKTGTLPLASAKSPEILLLLDWSDVAGSIFGGYSRSSTDVGIAVANALTAPGFLADLGGVALADLPMHLLGHSRGASVVAQIAAQLARRDVWVDQLTTFDPVPISLYSDPVAFAAQNVAFYDNYYQQQDSIAIGTAISGAQNEGPLSLPGAYVNFLGNGYHDNTHLYYQGTIDTSAGAADYNHGVSSSWYSGSDRTTTGFLWSQEVGGTRPSGGVASAFGGSASRRSVSVDLPAWSNIGSITTTSNSSLSSGQTLTANFNYQDTDSASTVTWLLDPDQNPLNGNEITITTQNLSQAGNVTAGSLSAAVPNVTTGTYYLLGRIADASGTRQTYAAGSLTITQGPTMKSSLEQFNAGFVSGWIYDPALAGGSSLVRITIDGVIRAQYAADTARADLATAFGTANHAFSYRMPCLAAGDHTVTVFALANGSATPVQLASKVFTSFSGLFDEAFYLETNPDVAAAVNAGHLVSGAQHYLLYGQYEHRQPTPLFDETYYLGFNADVAAAVANHSISSGFIHFIEYGQFEGRSPCAFWNEHAYLTMNADVAAGVAAGQYASGIEQFSLYGESQGRRPSAFFDPTFYDATYPDVAAAVAAGTFRSSFEHFLRFGAIEGRRAIALFDETYYLAHNPDVAAAVNVDHSFFTGYEHFVRSGQLEGRDPSAGFSESAYLARYPDVAAAVAAKQFRSGFEHYLLFGQAEGRLPL